VLSGYRCHADYLYRAKLSQRLFKIAHNPSSINLGIADISSGFGVCRDEAQLCAARGLNAQTMRRGRRPLILAKLARKCRERRGGRVVYDPENVLRGLLTPLLKDCG
jgi:hypothetical protein